MFRTGAIFVISLALQDQCIAGTVSDYLLEASDHAYAMALDTGGEKSSNWGQDWIKNAELRVQHEQEQNSKNSETYRLRIRPKYGRERTAELSSNTFMAHKTALQTETLLSTDLRRRYLNIIGLLELFYNTELLEDKHKLLHAEISAESIRHQSSEFNPGKVQNLIIDLEHTAAQLKLGRQRFEDGVQHIQLSIKDTESSFGDQFVSPELIQSVLQEQKPLLGNTQAMPAIQMAELERNIARMKLRIQQTKNKFGVDFVDLKYTDKNDSAAGITFGFRLPIGRDTGTLSRRLDKNKADSEYRQISDGAITAVREMLSEISWKYMAWQSDRQALENIKQLMAQPERLHNPSLITGLRRQQLSLHKDTNMAHIRMLTDYVELLDVTGSLGQHPLRNWLAPGSPVLVEQ